MVGFFGARLDKSGLGSQTHNLVRMLKPDVVLAIDSTSFNEGSVQDYHRFDGFKTYLVKGFPTSKDCQAFLNKGVTHVFACETVYNEILYGYARARGVKVFVQPNPEFFDGWHNPLGHKAYQFLMPSHWYLEKAQGIFPNAIYLPPPIFPSDFKSARDKNFARTGKRRFVHIVGKPAAVDRNGTNSILDALNYTNVDFELVVKTQQPLDVLTSDHRVRFDVGQVEDTNDMYQDFDAVIFPRRYGGLAIPLIEGLISGLPVIMTDIEPQRNVLPEKWMIPARSIGTLKTRLDLDVYEADAKALAAKLEWLTTMSDVELNTEKAEAFELGYDTYSNTALKPKYEALLK